MRKIFVFLVFIVWAISPVLGATIQEIDVLFQKGLECVQTDKIDDAIEKFTKIVSLDYKGLPQDYYEHTYGQAYYNIGMLYVQKGDNQQGIENLRKAVFTSPANTKALYYLAATYLSIGEIAKAKMYYYRAELLGFTKDKDNPKDNNGLTNYFNSLKDKKIIVSYTPLYQPLEAIDVVVKGTPCGDENLIRETIAEIEKFAQINEKQGLTPITVISIRQKENNKIIIEKWLVGFRDVQREIWVRYDFSNLETSTAKINIEVSDKEFLK